MADYYPLIARAIAGLDPSAPGESRRALYERARAALIAQLRSVEPPLSESEITRERLSLEEAVRKVESEAAQRARDASRSGGSTRAGDSFRAWGRVVARNESPARVISDSLNGGCTLRNCAINAARARSYSARRLSPGALGSRPAMARAISG